MSCNIEIESYLLGANGFKLLQRCYDFDLNNKMLSNYHRVGYRRYLYLQNRGNARIGGSAVRIGL